MRTLLSLMVIILMLVTLSLVVIDDKKDYESDYNSINPLTSEQSWDIIKGEDVGEVLNLVSVGDRNG